MAARLPPGGAWSTGLWDCTDDVDSCCMTVFCPCVIFGRIATIVDQGNSSCCLMGALYTLLIPDLSCLCSCYYRSKLRTRYGLEVEPCNDFCVHCWCETCALCQEYRELRSRGFNMAIGTMASQHGEVGKRHYDYPTADV
ncbi:hypothetical protein ACP4OV_024441 [Aristida adscensionis]